MTTRAIATYDSAVAEMDETDYAAYFEAAEKYNEELAALGSVTAIASPDLVDEDYWELLDISGTGIMGYITIDKIDVQLPIYHGTDAGVLQVGAGHLEGTSLPVGGESTHSVISAHRGLPSAKLFTDLDQLEVGDTFTITILDQVLTYEVDQITIVEPDELENIYIEEGKDYCTLMTCTPYGVNSHRLLVRGVRTENAEKALIYVTAEAYQIMNAYEIKTGMSRTKISHLMDAETWMDANSAVEMGFADEIMKRSDAEEIEIPQVSMVYSRASVTNSLMEKLAQHCKIEKPTENSRTADELLERLNLIKNHF